MKRTRKQTTVKALVGGIHFPHLQDGKGKWLMKNPTSEFGPIGAFDRLCFYACRLRELGMSDTDISCMFSDLYFDAVAEVELNKKAKTSMPG